LLQHYVVGLRNCFLKHDATPQTALYIHHSPFTIICSKTF
jgi:hypothetical protein